MKKRFLIIISVLLATLCALLCISFFVIQKSTVQTSVSHPDVHTLTLTLFKDEKRESFDLLADTTNLIVPDSDLVETIRSGILSEAKSIDISSFKIETQNYAILQAAMGSIMYLDADVFFIDLEYNVQSSGSYFSKVLPIYLYSGQELLEMRADYEARIASILEGVEDDFSDLETALYLHDYLVSHYEYDQSDTFNYNPYLMMTSGYGVCQAYTALYAELLTRCGIGVSYVQNNSINHIWNGVTIDGKNYYVDVTWDDAIGKMPDQLLHTYFLMSNESIMNKPQTHGTEWISTMSYDGEDYDSALWLDIKTPIRYLDGAWYGIDQSMNLVAFNRTFTSYQNVIKISDKPWYVFGSSGYYNMPYSGLEVLDGNLWFNSSRAILSWTPGDVSATTVFEYACTDGYIYGMSSSEGIIYYTIATKANPSNIVNVFMLEPPNGDTVWQKNYDYTLESSVIVLNRYKGNLTKITVPAYAVIEGRMYQTKIASTNISNDGIFRDKASLIVEIVFEDGVLTPEKMNYLLANMPNLTSVDVSHLDMSHVTSISGMFSNSSALTSLDLSNWDLSGLTNDAPNVFMGCEALDGIRVPTKLSRNIALYTSSYRQFDLEKRLFVSDKMSVLPKGLNTSVFIKQDKRDTPTLSVTNISVNYTAKPVAAPKVTTNSNGAVTIKYYSDKNCTQEIEGPPTKAGTYYFVATVEETGDYLEKSATGNIKISKISLTITVHNFEKLYGEPDPEFTYKISGWLEPEPLAVTTGREPGENAGQYQISPVFDPNPNYSVIQKSGKLTIKNVDMSTATLELSQASYAYDRTAHVPAVTVKLSVLDKERILVEGVDYKLTITNTVNAGFATVLCEGLDNYRGFVTTKYRIEKAPLLIEALPMSKTEGEEDPVLTGQLTGLVPGDEISVSYVRDEGETPGKYQITPVYENDQNYLITFKRSLFTIFKKDAILLTDSCVSLDQTSFTYNATEQKPFVTVTYEGNVLTEGTDYSVSVSDSIHAGTVTVTVTGMNSYGGTAYASYEITKAPLNVDIGSYHKTYGEPDPVFKPSFAGLFGTDSLALDLYREEGSRAGTYAVKARPVSSRDYEVTVTQGTLTIGKARLVVTTESAEKHYDGTPLTAPGSIEGAVNGDEITLKLTGVRTEVGVALNTYELTFKNPECESNYEIESHVGELTVLEAEETETDSESETETGKTENDSETEKDPGEETETETETETEANNETKETREKAETESDGTSPRTVIRQLFGCTSTMKAGSVVFVMVLLFGAVLVLIRKGKNSHEK